MIALLNLAIERRTFMLVTTLAIAFVGIQSFFSLGQLEDPEFTIKTALVVTAYPGATPQEVEDEVTDHLEEAIQSLGDVDDVRSISRPGQSIIIVDLKDTTRQQRIPQVWDELRREVSDSLSGLPPGVIPPLVVDDFGDVYGVFYALHGDGYDLLELKKIAEDLKAELSRVEDVASVEIWGQPTEVVNLEMSLSQLVELDLDPLEVIDTIERQSRVVEPGRVHAGGRNIRLQVAGKPSSAKDLEGLILSGRTPDSLFRLGDISHITREQEDRPSSIMYFNGQPAIGIGVSTVSGGNVVDVGQRIKAVVQNAYGRLPLGVELGIVSMQSDSVSNAVDSFLINLLEAVVIVVGILLLFMGLRSGLLIGGVLILTILGTFIFMNIFGIPLQRISLGALVIALGMLVDNAIVVVEGILVRIQQGQPAESSARQSVEETMWPLLGATIVAILAFAAISLSPDTAGEFLASLFQVIAISLLLSWVLAITVTPLFGLLFLRAPNSKNNQEPIDPYDNYFFHTYRYVLGGMIRFRWLTIVGIIALLFVAIAGFGHVKRNFFPDSSRPQFMVDYWRAEGSHINDTAKDIQKLEEYIRSLPGVTYAASFVGSGGLRFMLTYDVELPNPSYGQVVVGVDDYSQIEYLAKQIETWMSDALPEAEPYTKRFAIGPSVGAKIEARFSGPDAKVLRDLTAKAETIMRQEMLATNIRNDWRGRVPVLHTVMFDASARRAGISRTELSQSLALATEAGVVIGIHRVGRELLPIRIRLPAHERADSSAINNAQILSRFTGQTVPAGQVIGEPTVKIQDEIIRRRNRVRTMIAQCDPSEGVASALFAKLRPKIEAMEIPPGYKLEWGGEYESSSEANAMLLANIPLAFGMMVLIVVGLFNAIRTPIIIFLTVPLSIVGVTAGLLVFDQPFGFVAMLGFLSLSGMLIKNAIVLIEQININLNEGWDAYKAVVEAGVTRVRPVSMAAFTTVLGMIPLVSDVFFGALAVTIMGGLAFATVLTLLVVPVLYATIYGVKARAHIAETG